MEEKEYIKKFNEVFDTKIQIDDKLQNKMNILKIIFGELEDELYSETLNTGQNF